MTATWCASARRAARPEHRQARQRRAGRTARAAEGTVLTPARLGVIAALGLPQATVYARPRVAILCTGNEVVEPGRPLGPGQIYDVNTGTLAAVVREHGGDPVRVRACGRRPRRDRECVRDGARRRHGPRRGWQLRRRTRLHPRDDRGARRPSASRASRSSRASPPSSGSRTARPCSACPAIRRPAYRTRTFSLRRCSARSRGCPPGRRCDPRAADAAVSSPAGRHQFYPVRLEGGDAVPAFKGSGDITSLAGSRRLFRDCGGCRARG